ncbi:hypothetical protein V6O07_23630 [Arthrospira platensis SPKY2]
MKVKIISHNQVIDLSNDEKEQGILSSNLILIAKREPYKERKIQYISKEVKGVSLKRCFEEYIENIAIFLLEIHELIINKEKKIGIYNNKSDKLYLVCILRKDPYNKYKLFFICNNKGEIQIFNEISLLKLNQELINKGYEKGLLNTLEAAESVKRQYRDLTEQLKSLF